MRYCKSLKDVRRWNALATKPYLLVQWCGSLLKSSYIIKRLITVSTYELCTTGWRVVRGKKFTSVQTADSPCFITRTIMGCIQSYLMHHGDYLSWMKHACANWKKGACPLSTYFKQYFLDYIIYAFTPFNVLVC